MSNAPDDVGPDATLKHLKQIRSYICKACHVALYEPHPEQPYKWKKCEFCGFCELIDEDTATIPKDKIE